MITKADRYRNLGQIMAGVVLHCRREIYDWIINFAISTICRICNEGRSTGFIIRPKFLYSNAHYMPYQYI